MSSIWLLIAIVLVLHRERVSVPVRTFDVCTSVRLYSHSECETVRYRVPYVRLQHQSPTSSVCHLKNKRNNLTTTFYFHSHFFLIMKVRSS
jgi:hypothetical protein